MLDDTRVDERRRAKAKQHRPPFECIALLVQGDGALGSYQAGVYAALTTHDGRLRASANVPRGTIFQFTVSTALQSTS